MKDHRLGYWKDWYWNKGGRDKVQHSRKVTQPENYGNKFRSKNYSFQKEEERAA